MKTLFALLFIVHTTLLAEGPLRREYKEFRTYPRLDRAYKLIDQKEYGLAEELLLEVIRIDPKKKEAYNALVNLYVVADRYEEAGKYVGKLSYEDSGLSNYLASQKPKMPGEVDSTGAPIQPYSLITAATRLNLAYTLIDEGYYGKAENILVDLHYYYPEYTQPEEALVVLYLTSGDTARAVQYYNELPDGNPVKMRYATLGTVKQTAVASRKKGRPQKQRSLSKEEKRYFRLQTVYNLLNENENDKALEELEQLHRDFPQDTVIGRIYVQTLLNKEKVEQAETVAVAFEAEQSPRTAFSYYKMNQMVAQNQFKSAALMTDSLGISNDSVKAVLSYISRAEGYYLLSERRVDEAEESFRRSLYFKPDSEESLNALMALLISEKRLDEAAPFLRKVPSNSDVLFHYYLARSSDFRAEHEYDSAALFLGLIDSSHHNSVAFLAEKAYVKRGSGELDSALILFEQCRDKSENVGYTRELAFTHQKMNAVDSASLYYKKAVDELEQYALQNELSETEAALDSFNIQRSNYYLKKQWNFTFNFQPRLNSYEYDKVVTSPFEYASYSGYTSLEASFTPLVLRRYLTLFGNSLVSLNDQSPMPQWDSYQLGLGIKSSPFRKIPVTAVLQYNLGVGSNVRNVFMARLAGSYSKSLDWNPAEQLRLYTNNYGEAAYLIGDNALYLTLNSEIGPAFRLKKGIFAGSAVPYALFGANMNTDNAKREAVSRVDVGIGCSLFHYGWYDPYKSYRMRNRLSLELRRAVYTRGKDLTALHLKWELSL